MVTFSNPRTRAEFGDWPIGGAHRGKAVFEVHRDKRGYRVSRTTTDKHGILCKPKYTTYSDGAACIVDGSDGRTYVLMYSTVYGPSVRVVESDLQHDPPESRLGHGAYVREDHAAFDGLVKLIVDSAVVLLPKSAE